MSGYLDAALYVVMASITLVFLDNLSSHVDIAISLFVVGGIALVCFHLLAITQLKTTYVLFFRNWLVCCVMSIALGVDWFFMLFAAVKSDPFIAMSAAFVTLATFGFVRLFKETRSNSSLLSIGLLALSLILLGCIYETGSKKSLILGVVYGFISGACFYVYIVASTELTGKRGMTSIQILALRFWALFIGAAVFLPNGSTWIILDNIKKLSSLSVCSAVIPIFFSQRAIDKLGPAIASILFCFVPPLTYVFYAFVDKKFMWLNLLICIIIALALILPKLIDIMVSRKAIS